MEHAQPLNRTFPWRMAVLVASALALVTLAGLVLTHRTAQPRPLAATRHGHEPLFAVPLRPRSRISVLVLNGNGMSGAAGTEASKLLAAGYLHAVPTDAPLDNYATSLVLYRPGWQREAHRLARDAGIRVVAALDGRLPAGSTHDQLVVILGAN